MTPDEYWFSDPSLIYCYEKKYQDEKKFREYEMWLQGAYIKSAIQSSPVWTLTPAKASDWNKMQKYAENPLKDIVGENVNSEEELKLKRQIAYDYFKAILSKKR